MGTSDPPNDPRKTPDADPDRTLSTGAPGGAAAGQIGPYRLLQMLGEGGMGEVWLAEQKTPIHRTVALKLIKAGMDTKAVVARFESERQALAMMDHPSIARVFDAGSTAEGRPYFVMEYVPGLPITEYCDKHRLTIKERLELFLQVCEGVQHAHQKAIIHRDLKPSNVLVVEQDNKAVPKIIDFGLAKATAQRLTDKTMFTELGVIMGTPEYMSPEQADQREQNIDTRTDVYSLGVILYQLLVGALPFDAKAMRAAGFEEILRKIREEEHRSRAPRFAPWETLPPLRPRSGTRSRGRSHNTCEASWIGSP
jgi:eukaryotic-like serine/threonine-protein kinase